MKVEFQKLVNALREEGGIDLKETPALFQWSYEDDPYVTYELMITEHDQASLALVNRDEDEAIH